MKFSYICWNCGEVQGPYLVSHDHNIKKLGPCPGCLSETSYEIHEKDKVYGTH